MFVRYFCSLPLIYRWDRVGLPMPPSVVRRDNDRVLLIPEVQVEYSGTYRCTVERRNGQQISKETKLDIQGKLYYPIMWITALSSIIIIIIIICRNRHSY